MLKIDLERLVGIFNVPRLRGRLGKFTEQRQSDWRVMACLRSNFMFSTAAVRIVTSGSPTHLAYHVDLDGEEILGGSGHEARADAAHLPEELHAEVLLRVLSNVVAEMVHETGLVRLLVAGAGTESEHQLRDGTVLVDAGDGETVLETGHLLFDSGAQRCRLSGSGKAPPGGEARQHPSQ